MTDQAPIAIQICAMGGQGGGVLAEWLTEAAGIAGFPAQATSIPGVAQRTGATSYYMEMAAFPNPAAKPIFSLYPDEDGIDLLVALEPLEAARALSQGFVTKRTTVITSLKRIYATSEKMVAGNGALLPEALIEPLESAAGQLIIADPASSNGKQSGPGNAFFLGAIAASGTLPLKPASYLEAIRQKSVAIEANTADFEAGCEAGAAPAPPSASVKDLDPAPEALAGELTRFPEALRPLIGHALHRLTDYQDEAYARLYIDRLSKLGSNPGGDDETLLGEVARRMAARMIYEDVIRVAQLKTRPGRLKRIRDELGLSERAPLWVTDFLKPGLEEFASIMPSRIGRWLMGSDYANASGRPIRLKASSFRGQVMMRFLAGLRRWRRGNYRYGIEQQGIEIWLDAVSKAAAVDVLVARDVAELAVLARGYGRVRNRGASRLDTLFDGWDAKLQNHPKQLMTEIKALLHQARHDPDAACQTDGEN